MSDYDTFKGITRKTISGTPEAAGLPSDRVVTQQLRAIVIETDPDSFWPEPRYGINGDGNFDPVYRAEVPLPRGVQGAGAIAFRLAAVEA